MRWMLGFIILLIGLVAGGVVFIKGYPYAKYSGWASGEKKDKYFSISGFKKMYLKPPALAEIPAYQEEYEQLWKDFPIRNALLPLPTRHPLFQTIPIIDLKGNSKTPHLGMAIANSSGREISRIYTLPVSIYQDHSQGQDLFKLPFVRNRIRKIPLDKLWSEVFSRDVVIGMKTIDEMILDLYVIHLRSKILPPQTQSYGLIKDGKVAMIELASKDKDYRIELVLSQRSGNIYSYVLKTEKNSNESKSLRSKFLQKIDFTPMDVAMGRILYTEFKQLNFARQVDQEGMLYLYSSWSQEVENLELLKEVVFYLERGRRYSEQLQPFYRYAIKRYGKSFTTRSIFSNSDDPNVVLQRKIEIENLEKKHEADKSKTQAAEILTLTPDERMNEYLKKAKEKGDTEAKEMTVH